ncbi:DUF5647 family protein [Thermus amyloliquefaciens]|uniref:DUF5647 family protein n=1 Tax=Thermus amyloliquefaciens TaxID=1449080 RepID=UPI003CCC0BA1
MQAGAEVSRFLYAHPEITARLPQSYRLVVLLLDDPEALGWALGQGKAAEGPVIYALVREGRVEGLLTPEGPVALGGRPSPPRRTQGHHQAQPAPTPFVHPGEEAQGPAREVPGHHRLQLPGQGLPPLRGSSGSPGGAPRCPAPGSGPRLHLGRTSYACPSGKGCFPGSKAPRRPGGKGARGTPREPDPRPSRPLTRALRAL